MANPNPNHDEGDTPPQYTGHPFFDFLQSMQAGPGAGVDHRETQYPGFQWSDFAGPGASERRRWIGRGRRGGRRRGATNSQGAGDDTQPEQGASQAQAQDNEKEASPGTMRDVDDPPEEYPRGPGRRTHCGRRGPHPFPFWGPGPFGHHGPHVPGPHHSPPPPPFPFDARTIHSFVHPLAQAARTWGEQIRRAAADNTTYNTRGNAGDHSFEPPIDIFSTERAFVLHVALPGAKKEDVGVNWDGDKGELSIAGVVYRPGDEEFLQTMVSSERKAGMFERAVKLPPEGAEKEEIDDLAISAKMEDGVLIVTVPKLEKEWTEIRKVDIE